MQNSKVLTAQFLPKHSITFSNHCLLTEGPFKKIYEALSVGFWILCNWFLNFVRLDSVACAINSWFWRISQAQSQKFFWNDAFASLIRFCNCLFQFCIYEFEKCLSRFISVCMVAKTVDEFEKWNCNLNSDKNGEFCWNP